MSPASQGALEVERYIGSCLISSSVRPSPHKEFMCKKTEASLHTKPRCYSAKNYAPSAASEQCQGQYGSGTWAGTPLISMTSTPRRINQQRSSPSPGQQQGQQQHQQCGNEQQMSGHLHNKNPLLRLAIHTQGVPLILTGRFHNRGKSHNVGVNSCGGGVTGLSGIPTTGSNGNPTMASNNSGTKCPNARIARLVEQPAKKPSPKSDCTKEASSNNITNIDSLSIASDESSNNSENSLPRIIKPRKRRKKDRKPPNGVLPADVTKPEEQPVGPGNNSVEQVATSLPKGQSCYESASHFKGQRRPQPVPRESAYGRLHSNSSSLQEVVDTRHRYAYRHVQVKVLDDNRNVIVPLPVRQVKGYRGNSNSNNNINSNSNNNNHAPRYVSHVHEIGEGTIPGCQGAVEDCYGACQCRYCEPSSLMWDVDRNGYTQFLPTTTSGDFVRAQYPQQVPVFLSRTPYGCHEHAPVEFYEVDSPSTVCLHHERDGSVAVLRRSWSDPVSYFSEEIVPNRDVGVIGDRGQSELKGRSSWRGDASSSLPDVASPSSLVVGNSAGNTVSQGLEVSTEIVTSPNGHRDLEIKFYSSSPSSAVPEEDKLAFPFPEEDGDEDFSDIWSYHESKLQQDFRTLLQAEE